MVCPYSLSIPGGAGAGAGAGAPDSAEWARGWCWRPATVRRRRSSSSPRSATASRPPPTGRWRRSLDPAAALRTLRAARRGVRRDPRARAVGTRSVAHDRHAPCRTDGRHVPRRGALDQLPPAGATAAPLLDRIDERAVVSKDALASCSTTSAARRRLHRALQRRRDGRHPRRHAVADDTTGGLLPRPARRAQGLAVLLQAFRMLDLDVSCWVAGDGPDTDRCGSITPATPGSSGWAASTRRRSSPACEAPRSCAPRRCTASRSASR